VNAALTAALAGWSEFFVAAAGAGAVLLGLVFIGLSIHLEGRKEQPELVPLAIGSAVTLFYPVIISLLMLMPPAQPWLPTGGLLVVALFAALSAGAPILDSQLRALWIGQRKISDAMRYGFPFAAALALVGVAVWLATEPAVPVYIVGVIIVLYLIVGTQNAWNLLLAGRFDVSAWGVKRSGQDEGHGETDD